MPSLDQITDDIPVVHLLLIGDTKVGKTTYAAEAAIEGFDVVYIDADNGLSALTSRVNAEPDPASIMKRINYFRPRFPVSFVTAVLKSRSKKPLFWLADHHREYKAKSKTMDGVVDSDRVWIFDIEQIPRNTVLAIDSWTTLAADTLGLQRADQVSELLDGSADQSLYGEARSRLTYITNLIQSTKCHVIVQAHGTRYEIFEKPKGSTGAPKQRDMVLTDTISVPISSSRGHGMDMASRFNAIGWMEISALGATEIDFTRKPGRIGGGPANKRSKSTDLTFKKLVEAAGGSTESPPREVPWYQETTVGELKEILE